MITRLNDAAVEAFVRFTVALRALFAPAPAAGVLSARTASRARAVSFFEYAILAAIVIVVGMAFRESLRGVLQAMWSNIQSTWKTVQTG